MGGGVGWSGSPVTEGTGYTSVCGSVCVAWVFYCFLCKLRVNAVDDFYLVDRLKKRIYRDHTLTRTHAHTHTRRERGGGGGGRGEATSKAYLGTRDRILVTCPTKRQQHQRQRPQRQQQ